jgi:hypothetical protein
MYHPFAMDQIRVSQQDELRLRLAAARWDHETIESRPQHQLWPRRGRSMRAGFRDSAMRPACVDC